MSDEDFAKFLEKQKATGLPTPVGNNFIPADLKLVGPEIDKAKQMEFVRKAFERAQKLGLKVIVLGSGGARKVPDGFSQDEAWKQLVDFAKRIAPEAKKRGVVVAVEPLQKRETNTINSAAEGLKWVQGGGSPQLPADGRLLSPVAGKGGPGHPGDGQEAHQAHPHRQPQRRAFPACPREEFDYSAFFANLKKINYTGGISIEGRSDDYDTEGPKALAFLRGVASGVKPPSARRRRPLLRRRAARRARRRRPPPPLRRPSPRPPLTEPLAGRGRRAAGGRGRAAGGRAGRCRRGCSGSRWGRCTLAPSRKPRPSARFTSSTVPSTGRRSRPYTGGVASASAAWTSGCRKAASSSVAVMAPLVPQGGRGGAQESTGPLPTTGDRVCVYLLPGSITDRSTEMRSPPTSPYS